MYHQASRDGQQVYKESNLPKSDLILRLAESMNPGLGQTATKNRGSLPVVLLCCVRRGYFVNQ